MQRQRVEPSLSESSGRGPELPDSCLQEPGLPNLLSQYKVPSRDNLEFAQVPSIDDGTGFFTCVTMCLNCWVKASILSHNFLSHSRDASTGDCCKFETGNLFCLNTRIRSHTGEKPFRWPSCLQTFVKSSDLKRHLHIHPGDQPYHCTNCSKSFVQAGNLRTHGNTAP
ncbi:hypothetical protein HPB49_008284 [Dermacentor silvarum]|uniref:Uncharacterized protein n=1 Tax=Dermacentor silvarum TaxID=543639 RepID=A0ACB8CQT9_DERSI|nr:hypothetical protein HPB49_008284 [Dermacentor silvarum]